LTPPQDLYKIAIVPTNQVERRHVQKLRNLRELRERMALTQAEAAERAGVALSTYRYIETLEVSPRPQTVRKIAHALRVDPQELWAESTAPKASGRPSPELAELEERPDDEALAGAIDILTDALSEEGEAVLERLKDSGLDIPVGAAYPFVERLEAWELLLQVVAQNAGLSGEAAAAESRLDAVARRVGDEVHLRIRPPDEEWARTVEAFSRRRRAGRQGVGSHGDQHLRKEDVG
jgi:transcriptional regulator with XRE-family HTH domain